MFSLASQTKNTFNVWWSTYLISKCNFLQLFEKGGVDPSNSNVWDCIKWLCFDWHLIIFLVVFNICISTVLLRGSSLRERPGPPNWIKGVWREREGDEWPSLRYHQQSPSWLLWKLSSSTSKWLLHYLISFLLLTGSTTGGCSWCFMVPGGFSWFS